VKHCSNPSDSLGAAQKSDPPWIIRVGTSIRSALLNFD
jgi:hypothetical protein